MGNACSDITPTFDAQKKLEDDKASLTRDLVMDEEATSNLPMTFQARYKMGDILGKGAFSTVRLGTSKINNKKWAVKAVARKDLPQVDTCHSYSLSTCLSYSSHHYYPFTVVHTGR